MAEKIKIKTRIPKQKNRFENSRKTNNINKVNENYKRGNLSGQESKSYLSLNTEIQPKLIGDNFENILELEADKIARDVLESEEEICPVCMEDEKTISKSDIGSGEEGSFVQRKDTGDEKKKKEEEKVFAMQENTFPTVEAPSQFESKIGKLRGKGKEMPESLRSYFEPRFGYDFSDVRIHNDNEAIRLASSINAYAFTLGRDIMFGRGAYVPETFEGKNLLAHELTHVVQQNKTNSPEKCNPVEPVENKGNIPPINNVAQTVIQRNGDEESEEIAKRALERITMVTMQETAEWLDQRDFSFTDPIISQAAPKLCEAAKQAFKDLKPRYTERNKAVETSIKKVNGKISVLNAKSERTDDDDKLLEQYKSAHGALTSGKEIDPPEAVWNSSHCNFKKRQEEDFANKKLGQYKGEIEAAISGAKTAVRAYAAALEKFAKAKAELQKKMIELNIYDPEKNRIRPCVRPKGETTHPTTVSDAHVNKIKKGEGFAPLPYIALEGNCTIGYGHVIHWKRCGAPPESPCWEPGPGMVPVGAQNMPECITHPPMSMSEPQAHEQLKRDCNVHAGWIKDHVFVDLCQEQFDALVDISGHKGHTDEDLVKEIHEKWCTDNEAVRKKYLETDLYIKNHPEKGPIFKGRREERVWPAKESEE
jgi:GH24 family phage-related lysozyme (muramidase)